MLKARGILVPPEQRYNNYIEVKHQKIVGRYQDMRIILKIIVDPAAMALTLIVVVLNSEFPLRPGCWHPVPYPCSVLPVRTVYSEQSTMGDHRAGACFSAFPFRAARRSRMAGLQVG